LSEHIRNVERETKPASFRRSGLTKIISSAAADGHPLLRLQRIIGNKGVQRLLRTEKHSSVPVCDHECCADTSRSCIRNSVPVSFVARGKTAEAPTYFERRVQGQGSVISDLRPSAFISAGRTGVASYYLAGGPGGLGNERPGLIQGLVPPQIDSLNIHGETSYCVRQQTGIVGISRSYTGVRAGDQGQAGPAGRWFITSGAAARINQHEEGHIAESRRIHDATIAPMEQRLAERFICPLSRRGQRSGLDDYLSRYVGWNTAIAEFRRQDRIRNQSNGTFDAEELNGPRRTQECRNVLWQGVAYDVYMYMPGESCPSPASP